jgi:hypothetical protein
LLTFQFKLNIRGKLMNFKLSAFLVILCIILASVLVSKPSFNGTSQGCSGSSCHSFNDNDVSAESSGNLEVQVTVSGVQSGELVAGELVDAGGTVVDVVESTSDNPFTLTAPVSGRYLVNSGYKKPSRNWDSVYVNIAGNPSSLVNNSNGLITNLELLQNYPNPFNPTTTIEFTLSAPAFVTVNIYNHLGQKVVTLLNNEQPAGSSRIKWDATGFASGIYYYRITAGDFEQTRRMLLIK